MNQFVGGCKEPKNTFETISITCKRYLIELSQELQSYVFRYRKHLRESKEFKDANIVEAKIVGFDSFVQIRFHLKIGEKTDLLNQVLLELWSYFSPNPSSLMDNIEKVPISIHNLKGTLLDCENKSLHLRIRINETTEIAIDEEKSIPYKGRLLVEFNTPNVTFRLEEPKPWNRCVFSFCARFNIGSDKCISVVSHPQEIRGSITNGCLHVWLLEDIFKGQKLTQRMCFHPPNKERTFFMEYVFGEDDTKILTLLYGLVISSGFLALSKLLLDLGFGVLPFLVSFFLSLLPIAFEYVREEARVPFHYLYTSRKSIIGKLIILYYVSIIASFVILFYSLVNPSVSYVFQILGLVFLTYLGSLLYVLALFRQGYFFGYVCDICGQRIKCRTKVYNCAAQKAVCNKCQREICNRCNCRMENLNHLNCIVCREENKLLCIPKVAKDLKLMLE